MNKPKTVGLNVSMSDCGRYIINDVNTDLTIEVFIHIIKANNALFELKGVTKVFCNAVNSSNKMSITENYSVVNASQKELELLTFKAKKLPSWLKLEITLTMLMKPLQ